jgi:hypothetical protein
MCPDPVYPEPVIVFKHGVYDRIRVHDPVYPDPMCLVPARRRLAVPRRGYLEPDTPNLGPGRDARILPAVADGARDLSA